MHKSSKVLAVGALAVGLAALQAVTPRAAQACGGFFCQRTPIDQSGEYILFSIDDRGVTAYIQIQYQGKAEDFAWVVPVMSKPRNIGVGVQQVFTTLMAQTVPQFRIDWGGVGESCRQFRGPLASAGGSFDAGAAGGVMVLGQGEVGPYNYVVVSADESAKLKQWLDMNGFVQPASAEAPLMHYVQQGFVFVAIKLKRGADVGEIQPLILEMDHGEVCVPLVLTRIAALPDMPIYAMVLGKHRAVPKNWFEVEVNPKKIDWFSGGQNYRSVVTSAINEAAGRAFVTEFAGDTGRFKQALYRPGQYDLTRLNGITDPIRFVQTMLQLGLPRDPLIQSMLRKHIPMPESLRMRGVTEAMFYNNMEAYRQDLAGKAFDGAAFIKDLQDRIVQPLIDAQKMIDAQAYFTRMFTTVSPDEMTRDPLFDFNPDLKPVSNVHVATGNGMCASDGRISNVTLTFENGERQSIPGTFNIFVGPADRAYAQAEPAARRVNLVSDQGQPIPISKKRVEAYDQHLATMDITVVRRLALAEAQENPEPVPPTLPPLPTGKDARGGGCAAGGNAEAGAAAFALLIAAVVLRGARRRRTR